MFAHSLLAVDPERASFPRGDPFTAVHQEVGRHQFTEPSRDHPRGLLFSANVHALLQLIDHERAIRVPIAASTRFRLPGAEFGVRALCLGHPGREHGGWFTAAPVQRPRPSKAGLRFSGDTIGERFSARSLVHSFTTSVRQEPLP